jgi:hypothetical protein
VGVFCVFLQARAIGSTAGTISPLITLKNYWPHGTPQGDNEFKEVARLLFCPRHVSSIDTWVHPSAFPVHSSGTASQVGSVSSTSAFAATANVGRDASLPLTPSHSALALQPGVGVVRPHGGSNPLTTATGIKGSAHGYPVKREQQGAEQSQNHGNGQAKEPAKDMAKQDQVIVMEGAMGSIHHEATTRSTPVYVNDFHVLAF